MYLINSLTGLLTFCLNVTQTLSSSLHLLPQLRKSVRLPHSKTFGLGMWKGLKTTLEVAEKITLLLERKLARQPVSLWNPLV